VCNAQKAAIPYVRFTFVARQKRMLIDGEDFSLGLLF
jgi:hypothetical protein